MIQLKIILIYPILASGAVFYPLSQMSCYSSCPFNKTAVLSLAIPDKLMVSIVIYIKALLDIAQSQE